MPMQGDEGNIYVVDESYVEATKALIDSVAQFMSNSVAISFTQISVDQLKLDVLANSLGVFGITDPIGEVKEWFYDRLKEIASFFSSIVESIVRPVKSVVDSIWSFIQGIPDRVVGGIRTFIESLSKAVSSIATSLSTYISQIISQISNAITSISSALQNVASSLISSITGALSSVGNAIQNTISSLISRVWDAIQGIGTAISSAFERVSSAISSAVSGIIQGVQTFFSQLGSALQSIGQSILGSIQNLASMVQSGVQSIAQGIASAVQNFTSMIQGAIQGLASTLTSLGERLWSGIQQIGSSIAGVVERIWSGIQSIGQSIVGAVQGFVSMVQGAISSVANTLSGLISRAWEAIQSGLRFVGEQLQGLGKWLLDSIQGGLRWLWDNLSSIGARIWEGLQWFGKSVADLFGRVWEGIQSGLKWLLDALTGIGTRIWDGIQWIGKNIADMFIRTWDAVKGVGEWVWKGIQGFAEQVQRMFSDIGNRVMGALSTIGGALSSFGKMMVDGFTTLGKTLTDFAKIFDKWATALMGGLSAVGNAFGQFLQAVANLPQILQNMFKGVVDFFSKLVEAFEKFIRDPGKWLYDHIVSPLWGGLVWLGEKIWEGLQKFGEIILKGLQWIWDRLVGAFNWIRDRVIDFGKLVVETLFKVGEAVSGWASGLVSMFFVRSSPETYRAAVGKEGEVERIFQWALKRTAGVADTLWDLGAKLVFPFWLTILPISMIRAVTSILKELALTIEPKLAGSGLGNIAFKVSIAEIVDGLVEGFRIFYTSYSLGMSMALANMFVANVGQLYVPRLVVYYDDKIRDIIGDIVEKLGVGEAEINMFVRPVSESNLIEYARRRIAVEGYEKISKKVIDTVKLHIAMYGLPRWYYEYVAKKHDEFYVTVLDRWQKQRTIPMSPLWEVPTRSELVTMMIRDMFYTPDDFQKVMYAHGVYKDVSLFYYLLHFRYPSPEKLADFYWRGMAKVLWFDKTLEEESMKAFFGIQDIKASTPKELNKKPKILNDMIMMYMKWHDYAPFAWHPEFPTDKSIVVELMADLPDKVDFRWLCRWAILEHMSALGVKMDTAIDEIVSKLQAA
ncbi:MAG: hypothetical protein LM583_07895, partial [Desulfurococcaceae archaeon]|nr:hypothetical protein [Desulfurococcaceae archaeon]